MGREETNIIHEEKIQNHLGHTTHLKDHSGLLQQVGPHVGPNDVVPFVKADLNILSKTAAVVIASGFSISDGLLQTNERCEKRIFLISRGSISTLSLFPPLRIFLLLGWQWAKRKQNKTSFACLLYS